MPLIKYVYILKNWIPRMMMVKIKSLTTLMRFLMKMVMQVTKKHVMHCCMRVTWCGYNQTPFWILSHKFSIHSPFTLLFQCDDGLAEILLGSGNRPESSSSSTVSSSSSHPLSGGEGGERPQPAHFHPTTIPRIKLECIETVLFCGKCSCVSLCCWEDAHLSKSSIITHLHAHQPLLQIEKKGST